MAKLYRTRLDKIIGKTMSQAEQASGSSLEITGQLSRLIFVAYEPKETLSLLKTTLIFQILSTILESPFLSQLN